MVKHIEDTHYICSRCMACYFSDPDSADACYDNHTAEEIKEAEELYK